MDRKYRCLIGNLSDELNNPILVTLPCIPIKGVGINLEYIGLYGQTIHSVQIVTEEDPNFSRIDFVIEVV